MGAKKKARLSVDVDLVENRIVSDWTCPCMAWREFPHGEPKGHKDTKCHKAFMTWKTNFESDIRKADAEVATRLSNEIMALKSELSNQKALAEQNSLEELDKARYDAEMAKKKVYIWQQCVVRKDKEIDKHKEEFKILMDNFGALRDENKDYEEKALILQDKLKKQEEAAQRRREKKMAKKRVPSQS